MGTSEKALLNPNQGNINAKSILAVWGVELSCLQ